MNKINRKVLDFVISGKLIIIIASLILVYLLISLYFTKHFFLHTIVNGVNLSLKAYDDADTVIRDYISDYELQLIERNNETEFITGQEIGLQYNEKNSISKIYKEQNSFLWINSLFKNQNYYVKDLYLFPSDKLEEVINDLMCTSKTMAEPKNASFQYTNGYYTVIAEVYGNKIILDSLRKEIRNSILRGNTSLDLDQELCYKAPKYFISSDKTLQTRNILNKYVATKITYHFGKKVELLDGNIIQKWLFVDEDLNAMINRADVRSYVNELSKNYDTVGITREFKASTGKTVEVKGGIYGWKINREEETQALIEAVEHGVKLDREPVYQQKALSREGNEIGDTYVELNITRQYLWFYKDGKLIAQGSVVTGNPNRGMATVVGTYMINYKQNLATLKGVGYEVEVKYWMPFYGNMGIHDARWRSSFGGEIYKRNGTHGCVNSPLHLAKTIFENIEAGIPVVSYEEEED